MVIHLRTSGAPVHHTGGNETYFNHNGDFSGLIRAGRREDNAEVWAEFEVFVKSLDKVQDDRVRIEGFDESGEHMALLLSAEDVRTLIGQRIIDELIGELEQLDPAEAIDRFGSEKMQRWAQG